MWERINTVKHSGDPDVDARSAALGESFCPHTVSLIFIYLYCRWCFLSVPDHLPCIHFCVYYFNFILCFQSYCLDLLDRLVAFSTQLCHLNTISGWQIILTPNVFTCQGDWNQLQVGRCQIICNLSQDIAGRMGENRWCFDITPWWKIHQLSAAHMRSK